MTVRRIVAVLVFVGSLVAALLYVPSLVPRSNVVPVYDLAAAASNNNLSLLLQQTDSLGSPILNRAIGPVQYAGSVGVFTNAILTDTNAHSQTLPTTTVLQFYFKNTSTTGNITVTWTPSGGSSNVVKKVGAGGVLAWWEATTGAGMTALSIQSDTSNETYEMFLGG